MATGDTIAYEYDKLNGKLHYTFVTHADGSWTVYQIDTRYRSRN